jgi:8-oxo-dGTP pyrophosphatase MutT (NUDIX family)
MSVTLERLRAHLLNTPPMLPLAPARGDYDLNPENRPPGPRTLLPAAVLLPIVTRREPTVLFTERSPALSRHAGQVSFPGGRVQPDDASLIETALRETREETGIAPEFVTVAGFLDAYETGTGYAVLPVVGLLSEGFALTPDTNEVAEIFEVPLAFLLDPSNRQKNQTEWNGRLRSYYAYRYNGHYIWGATAAMLVNFGERLAAAP